MKSVVSALVFLLFSSLAAAEPSSPVMVRDTQKKQEATEKVARDKKILNDKIRAGASAEEIGAAKTQLQTDRVEKNRQEYLHDPNRKPLKDDSPQKKE